MTEREASSLAGDDAKVGASRPDSDERAARRGHESRDDTDAEDSDEATWSPAAVRRPPSSVVPDDSIVEKPLGERCNVAVPER